MTTTIWLARHGETHWTVEDRFNGWSDTGLTDKGREQAVKLGEWLENEPITAVYCSSLSRCIRTAQLAGIPQHIEPVKRSELKELDYGVWDGMLRSNISIEYPEVWKAWVDNPAKVAPPEGETGYDVVRRVRPFVEQIVDRHSGETILLVAHKAVNRLILCDFLGAPLRNYRARVGQFPCALNCIQWLDEGPRVNLLNSIAHYRCLDAQ
jgi:broad specificity phosphatase PhoE